MVVYKGFHPALSENISYFWEVFVMGVVVREKIHGSGIWWVFAHHHGNRASFKVGTKANAEKAAEMVQAQILLGQFSTHQAQVPQTPPLRVYSQTWLDTCVKGILDDMTYERYGYVLRRDILPPLGEMALDAIEPRHVRDLLNNLTRAGRTSKSVSLVRTVLKSCLEEAVVEGYIQRNPISVLMHNRKRSKTAEARRPKVHKVNPLRQDEVDQLIDTAMSYSPDMYGPMFLCDLRTGMRLGEVIALHWDDILWDRGVIHLRRMFKRGVVKELKDGEDRLVDMSDQLKEVLSTLYERRKLAAANGHSGEVSPIIFNSKGGYRAQNTVRKAFKTALKRSGLREVRFHDLRHTFASLLLQNGAGLAYIKDQLGHSSIKTTGDIYGHLVPGSMRHVVNMLDAPAKPLTSP